MTKPEAQDSLRRAAEMTAAGGVVVLSDQTAEALGVKTRQLTREQALELSGSPASPEAPKGSGKPRRSKPAPVDSTESATGAADDAADAGAEE